MDFYPLAAKKTNTWKESFQTESLLQRALFFLNFPYIECMLMHLLNTLKRG